MSASSFVEKITGLQLKRDQQTNRQYAEIVAAITMGKEPDAQEVDRVLAEADKSVDDLKADVEKSQQRIMLHAHANSLPTFLQEREEIQNRLRQIDAEFAKAEKHHQESRYPLETRLRQCDEAIREATSAREELVTTCDDETLLAEMDHVESEIERVSELNRDLLSKATYFEDKADTESMLAEREISTGDRDHRREKSKSL